MIRWTGLAPWEFEFPFPGSLTSTFRNRVSAVAVDDLKLVCQWGGQSGVGKLPCVVQGLALQVSFVTS